MEYGDVFFRQVLEELKAVSLESQRCEMERRGDPGNPEFLGENHEIMEFSLGSCWGLKWTDLYMIGYLILHINLL